MTLEHQNPPPTEIVCERCGSKTTPSAVAFGPDKSKSSLPDPKTNLKNQLVRLRNVPGSTLELEPVEANAEEASVLPDSGFAFEPQWRNLVRGPGISPVISLGDGLYAIYNATPEVRQQWNAYCAEMNW